jgi:hypothetical protein
MTDTNELNEKIADQKDSTEISRNSKSTNFSFKFYKDPAETIESFRLRLNAHYEALMASYGQSRGGNDGKEKD